VCQSAIKDGEVELVREGCRICGLSKMKLDMINLDFWINNIFAGLWEMNDHIYRTKQL
jgi:hypothetical protein